MSRSLSVTFHALAVRSIAANSGGDSRKAGEAVGRIGPAQVARPVRVPAVHRQSRQARQCRAATAPRVPQQQAAERGRIQAGHGAGRRRIVRFTLPRSGRRSPAAAARSSRRPQRNGRRPAPNSNVRSRVDRKEPERIDGAVGGKRLVQLARDLGAKDLPRIGAARQDRQHRRARAAAIVEPAARGIQRRGGSGRAPPARCRIAASRRARIERHRDVDGVHRAVRMQFVPAQHRRLEQVEPAAHQ